VRQRRRPYRGNDDVDDEDAISDNLAAVNERLDDLTRQLERMAQVSAPRRSADGDEPRSDRVADALARLDRRLDQVIQEGRAAAGEPTPRALPPAPVLPAEPRGAAAPGRGPANWAAQISARQRALEGGAPAAVTPVAATPAAVMPVAVASPMWEPAADLTGLEQQLRQINSQISRLHRPYEDAVETLRKDLAGIGHALTEAMPRRAIEALEADVRSLAERLDRTRQAGADGTALATLEHGLQEIRDALRGLTPAESLVGFEDAVRGLSDRIDHIAGSAQPAQDPQAFKQLEQAVMSLRGIVSNVASDSALAQLAGEVRTLASQFERAAVDSGAEALSRLEARITTLMETGRAIPPELEGSIRQLSERLDRMQLSQGDQLALVALEDRIAKLSEKLDASDARLRQLDSIERGLADLLVHLEEMRNSGSRGPRALQETAPPVPIQSPTAAPRSPLDLIQSPSPPARVAAQPAAATPPPPPPPPPAPLPLPAPAAAAATEFTSTPVPAKATPRAPERPPIDPNLPPHTPLEPGSGVPRVKPGSAAARIAASEAALGQAKPVLGESGGKSAAIAAARNAAKAAYLDTPVNVPPTLRRKSEGWFKWPARKQKTQPVPVIPVVPAAPPIQPVLPADNQATDHPLSRSSRALRFLKTLLIAASVAIIIVGATQTALELLWPEDPATAPGADAPPSSVPSRPMPTPESSLPAVPQPDRDTTGQINRAPSFFDPSSVVVPSAPRGDVTGSIGRQPAPPRPAAPVVAPAPVAAPPSPPQPATAINEPPPPPGPTLLAAAAANNPAAEYEMGARYAEGRGVPANPQEAVRWLERAANAGFAPAQFRLASLNEKGEGIKKNLPAARRLYLAAAGKGHAKAMHNLAVLHAEGVDGKPDYKIAAQWFRKAAGYGVTDSQYNLAILYARGIGVETNLAESYKWFALAAGNGDAEAAKKRDEVGARLDQSALAAAKQAAQAFIPEREPEEATSLKAPPGGWDRAQAPAAKPRKKPPASPAQ
jgi:localization factor PodJL